VLPYYKEKAGTPPAPRRGSVNRLDGLRPMNPEFKAMADENKPSKVEILKFGSHQLRGTIAEQLIEEVDHITDDNANLLKHHGSYQQDNRDQRKDKNPDGTLKGKRYYFMVRTRVPGGKVTAEQFLAELDLCEAVGDGTLRITTRQGFQLHGVLKSNLKTAIRTINDIKLTTLAACGDVNRNVMCCPAPVKNSTVHDQMQQKADELAQHLKPKTTAYWEIWLKDENGEDHNVCEYAPVEEPIYGEHYLPRKFKIGVALPEDNCIDIHTQDLGFLAEVKDNQIVGYNVLVGGGMGMTPSAKKTFPALAKPMAYVTPDQVIKAAEAVVKVQRDFGNRSDRKLARLKYLIHNIGLDAFKAKVDEYYGEVLPPAKPFEVTDVDDHMGWHDQGDGLLFLGINIENGRIKDEGDLRIKTGLRAILSKYKMRTRLTALQGVILCDIDPANRADIESLMRQHGMKRADELTMMRRFAIACPAWPTCGLAITEAERALPGILDQLEGSLAKFGLQKERITVHMTGCPNGCARPYTPDIGLVGKAAGEQYTLYLGGNAEGTRLAFNYRDSLPSEEVNKTLYPLFAFFKSSRRETESFGDFCKRLGKENLEVFASTWSE